MPETKPKTRKTVRRTKAANSPSPAQTVKRDKFAACGHSHCGESCNVRYVGPVSPIRDHHIWHVARGVSHIWTAAIIAGLAVVLTGAVAYSSVNAANQKYEDQRMAGSTNAILDKMQFLEDRLEVLEKDIQQANTRNTLPINEEPVTLDALFPSSN